MHKISFFISTVKFYSSLLTILYLNNIGLAYLEAKGKEDGVVTLPSGLLYKEIRAGNPDGKTPTINSPCECDYAGKSAFVLFCCVLWCVQYEVSVI